MRVGLIDVDGHNFPNLALMRISAYHKAHGDTVEWWWGIEHYEIVYMSKVFSDEYTPDISAPLNADRIVRGGTGYCINRGEDGKEHFDKTLNKSLPPEIEKMFPDYSIYPTYDFAVAMTSRGCSRHCPFCHVYDKEGSTHKVADVSDFWNGQKRIEVLDPNITACKEKRDLFRQYRETKAEIVFNQGLDIRLLNGYDIEDINNMRIKDLHFAWDNPKDDLRDRFTEFANGFRRQSNIGMVYVLTNYNSTMAENLYRIYTLRDLGYDPYVMVYDKPHAPTEIIQLQRWCNAKWIFKTTPRFEDYLGKKVDENQLTIKEVT